MLCPTFSLCTFHLKCHFDFKVSKSQFQFNKQSSSNNFIIDEQINQLCKNINSIKSGFKDLITCVFNKFVEKLDIYNLPNPSEPLRDLSESLYIPYAFLESKAPLLGK